jgi:hypothetical protein
MERQSVLTIRAGKRALERIRAHGLDPADVEMIPGAAGGPKGLGIAALDRAIFGAWLPGAPRTRHLVGASIGAWRFAAACRTDPLAALDDFARLYVEQSYPPRPSRRFVSQAARTMLAALVAGREAEILSNPGYRLHVLTVRGRWPLTRDGGWSTPLGFGMAALANAIDRRHLARFIDRTLFHDPRERPPFAPVGDVSAPNANQAIRFDAFHTHCVRLDAANLGEALVASASIPLVLEGVADIPQAPPGVYWDGGALHGPHRARLARQGHAVARCARRVAGQRGAGSALAGVPREAPPRQASRPQRLQALRRRRCGADEVLAEGDLRERPPRRRLPRVRTAPRFGADPPTLGRGASQA